MDGNKEAALKCMSIGQKSLKDGDTTRAYRFLSRAKRLDPTLPLEELLSMASKVESKEKAEEKDQGVSEDPAEGRFEKGHSSSSSTGVRHRNGGEHAPKNGSSYVPEQMEAVRRINKCKDYYEILGLSKDCSAEEIKKAYKKVSLKVHPDKNKAPGAEEAFKAVSKAFVCLNDEEMRKKYDVYGPEELQEAVARQQQQHVRRQHYSGNIFHDDMFDADEIFNAFFAARGPYMRTQRAAAGGARVQTQEFHFGLINLIQLLPILALILFSYFPSSPSVYSLNQVEPYHFQQVTKEHGVPFFVMSQEFEKDYPSGSPSRRRVEAQVERDYTEILGLNCRHELNRRLWNPSLKTPNCDALHRFQY